ncbi:MAG TPA: hypothetical protein VLA19_08155 [Herpetosiphonaceae bacterium]|nr:hypothetical protein [Herpetosiphonaceae bacterium]
MLPAPARFDRSLRTPLLGRRVSGPMLPGCPVSGAGSGRQLEIAGAVAVFPAMAAAVAVFAGRACTLLPPARFGDRAKERAT